MKYKHTFRMLILVIFILLIFVYKNGLGISKKNLEKDARESQQINSSWDCKKDISDDLAAMLFYNSALDKHTFSAYENRKGLSFGYFFRHGGSASAINQEIALLNFNEKGKIIFSLNKLNISKITWDEENESKEFFVNNNDPIVLILPSNSNNIIVYNNDNTPIDIVIMAN